MTEGMGQAWRYFYEWRANDENEAYRRTEYAEAQATIQPKLDAASPGRPASPRSPGRELPTGKQQGNSTMDEHSGRRVRRFAVRPPMAAGISRISPHLDHWTGRGG
ncbi:MAG: hypothetical protein IMX01_09050 [Limnochordaceae bacterium]|nr:hypothetical protein [Limnochordaceae bacterium]